MSWHMYWQQRPVRVSWLFAQVPRLGTRASSGAACFGLYRKPSLHGPRFFMGCDGTPMHNAHSMCVGHVWRAFSHWRGLNERIFQWKLAC